MRYVLQEIWKNDEGKTCHKNISSYNRINAKGLKVMREKKKELEKENTDKNYRIVKNKVIDTPRYDKDE